LGTLLKRYLKPGGSGIFLVDIYCYDPPEWCGPALATSCAVGLHLSMRAAQPLIVTSVDLCAAGAQPARGGQGADIQGQGDRGARRAGHTLAASMRSTDLHLNACSTSLPLTTELKPRHCTARAVAAGQARGRAAAARGVSA